MDTHRTHEKEHIMYQLIRDSYGVLESNPITDEVREIRDRLDGTVHLDDRRLAKITRLRLVSDPGHPLWDLSYCYGELGNGKAVRVILPRNRFSKRGLRGELVAMCREAHVYAKGLGLLDPETVSLLT